MIRRLGRRLGIYVLTLFAASVVIFLLLAVVPGDPAEVALGINATPKALAQTRAEFGLDHSLIYQYWHWLSGLPTGQFGTSYVTRSPVAPQIASRVQVSLWLIALSMLLAIAIALPLGIMSAVKRKKASGTVLTGVSVVGIAIPTFILAIILIAIFAVHLHWLPGGGWTPPSAGLGPFLKSVAMPVITLGVIQAALLSRYVRSATLEVLGQDYLRTARAKGMTTAQAFIRHGLRNTMIPVVTVLGLQIAALFVDTIIVERVFIVPGLGSLLLDGATNRDQLLVQGIVMVIVVAVLTISLIVDFLYVLIDPRLRSQ